MADAVEEVDGQADGQPDDEANPRVERQGDHLGKANQSAGNRNPRKKRAAEGALHVGSGFSKNEDAEADDGESKEGADGDEFAENADGEDSRHQCGEKAGDDRGDVRGSEFGVKLGKSFWEKAVLGHGEEDARLPHHHDENHGAETCDGTQLDKWTEPTETFSRTIDGQGDGGWDGEFLEGDDSGEDERDENVEDGAEEKGSKNSKGHVPLWVFALLRRGGNSIKADVGEEDDSGTGKNTAPTVLAETSGVFRNEGDPVVGVDVSRAAENEEDDDGELDDDDDIVETGGFTDPDHEEDGGGQADEDGREVE